MSIDHAGPDVRVRPWRPRSAGIDAIRLGMIVPSSNVTMERELPALMRARESVCPERFSFHSSRVRMRSVTPEELAAMNAQASRAATELADASVDIAVYACLVAVMAEGLGAHRAAEEKLDTAFAEAGCAIPVVSSAGALVDTLHFLGARRISLVAPYVPALTGRVCAYLEAEGFDVVDSRSLSVPDNAAVGRLDPRNLLEIGDSLRRDVDAVVISACVQMPSLPSIPAGEHRLGVPVISAATATFFQSLRRLGLSTHAPGGGHLLSGAFDSAIREDQPCK